jgi:hypothetical protein
VKYVRNNSRGPILAMGSFRWVRTLGESVSLHFFLKKVKAIQHSFEEEEIKESNKRRTIDKKQWFTFCS